MAENRKSGTNRLDTTDKGRAYFDGPFGINKGELPVVDQGWEGKVITVNDDGVTSLTATIENAVTASTLIGGPIRLDPGEDPNPTGTLYTSSSFLFQSSSNTGLGYDLYFRQDGNLVKWKWIESTLNSGILYGGVLTYSASTFYISSGSGIIVDHNATTSSEVHPIVQYISWPNITQSLIYTASSQTTYVYIDSQSIANQTTTFFTPVQYNNAIPIGRISHYSGSGTYNTINGVGYNIQTAYDANTQQNEFIRAFGPLKLTGFNIIAQSSSLRINVTNGEAYNLGGYYGEQPDFPSSYTNSNTYNTASIIRISRSGSSGAYYFNNNNGSYFTEVDPTLYDNNGTLSSVGGNFTIQRVFVNPVSGRAHIYYGQTTYNQLSTAQQSIATDTFTESPVTLNAYILAAYIIIKGNTTNLLNTTDCQIVQAGLFRSTAGGGGGGSTAVDAFVQGGNSFGTTATLGTNDNNSLQFETNNTTRVHIGTDGNVGIGTTSPANVLDVSGSLRVVGPITGSSISASSWISGSNLHISSNATVGGDLAVNGGDITTTSTDFNFVRGLAGTLYIGGNSSQTNFDGSVLMGSGNGDQITLGGSATDTVVVQGLFTLGDNLLNSNLIPTFDNSITIGSSSKAIQSIVVNQITASGISASGNITASAYRGSTFTGTAAIGFIGTSSWAVSASQALTASFIAPTGNAFVQGGNSFGQTAVLGTNDNQNLQFETSGSVRMTLVSSSGNVGIGTTSPTALLDVNGTAIIRGALTSSIISASSWISGSDLRISSTSTIGGTLGVTGATTLTGALTASNISASNNISGSTLHIVGSGSILGNVGIGTTSPVSRLHISDVSASIVTLSSPSSSLVLSSSGAGTGAARVVIGAGRAGNGESSFDLISHNTNGFSFRLVREDGINGSVNLANKGSGTFYIGNLDTGGKVEFYTGGISNRMVIDTSGNVGINQATPSALLHVNGTTRTEGSATFADDLNSPTFISGFAGSGWKLDLASTKYSLEVDDLTVRGTMKIYELLISQIRATNGSIFVSNTGKVETATDLGNNTYYLTFDTGSQYGHSFKVGDIIRAQRFNITASTIYQCNLVVAGVPNTQALTASFNGTYGTSSYGIGIYGAGITAITAPTGGMEFVRLGSTVDTNRQGTVYLTADDNNAPFVDVKDGVTSHDGFNSSNTTKVRMGKLSGITSPLFGSLSGYGLWASGSAYLEGTINATAGRIGGFTITNDAISGTGFFLSGSATGNDFFISSSNFNVKANGTITASNATLSGTITANAGRIGGFTITQDAITGSGFFLSGSATGNGFFISSSNFNVKADGTITASAGLIGGFNTTTTEIRTTGSITAVDNDTRTSITYPNLSLNKDGNITGSSLVLRKLIPSASTNVSYKVLDTETGIADFKNIGRPILTQVGNAYIQASTTQNNGWFTLQESPPCYLLPGENLLLITMQFYGNVSTGSNWTSDIRARHNARILVAIASGSTNPQLIGTGSYDGQAGRAAVPAAPTWWSAGLSNPYYPGNNSYLNNWITGSDPASYTVWQLSPTGFTTQNISPSGGISVIVSPTSSLGVAIIPTGSRGQYVKFFVQAFISQSGVPSFASYTIMTNTTLTTARGYGAASVGGGINTYDPNSNFGLPTS